MAADAFEPSAEKIPCPVHRTTDASLLDCFHRHQVHILPSFCCFVLLRVADQSKSRILCEIQQPLDCSPFLLHCASRRYPAVLTFVAVSPPLWPFSSLNLTCYQWWHLLRGVRRIIPQPGCRLRFWARSSCYGHCNSDAVVDQRLR